jgi:hypothetical protein
MAGDLNTSVGRIAQTRASATDDAQPFERKENAMKRQCLLYTKVGRVPRSPRRAS